MENVIEIVFQTALTITLFYVAITVGKALKEAAYHPDVINKKADSKE